MLRAVSRTVLRTHSATAIRPTYTLSRSFAVKVGETRYTKEHEYIKLTGDASAVIGISEHAQQELGDVVYVDLPDSNAAFTKGEPFGSVESVKAASSVYAPVDVKVTAVNDALKTDSGLVNKAAQGEGWMIKAEVKDVKQLEQLMDERAYKQHCADTKH